MNCGVALIAHSVRATPHRQRGSASIASSQSDKNIYFCLNEQNISLICDIHVFIPMNLNNCSTCSNDDCCSECMETNSVIDGLNRFDFCDALKLPFLCPPPFFRLTMSHKALFATQEIPPDSTEFVVINNYLQLTCNDKSNLTDCEKIRIYRYQRLSDIVPELGHPNWLLWTGVRGDNLESIKWEGLQLGKPKNVSV